MSSLATRLDALCKTILYALLGFFPLVFFPMTVDPLEVNKQAVLVIGSLAASLCWVGSMVVRKRFEIRFGWLSLAPLFLLGASVVSAACSPAPYLSWFGAENQQYLSVLTMFALTLLYYVVANRLDTEREHRIVHGILLGSAAIVGAIGTAYACFGQTLNTIGTVNALGIYLSASCVFGCGLWVASRPDHALLHGGWVGTLERIAIVLVCVETLVLLLALDYAPVWSVLIAGLAGLFILFFLRARDVHDTRRFIVPLVLLGISAVWAFWLPAPFRVGLPVEVTPSLSASTGIANAVLSSPSGLLGSGPGTYSFDYAQFHDADVNATALWAQRFDRAATFAHTVAASLGVIGLFAWGTFFLVIFVRALARVLGARAYRERASVLVDLCAWIVFVVAGFAYHGNMTTVFFLVVFGALVASQVDRRPLIGSFVSSPRVGFLFSAGVAACSLGLLTVLFMDTRLYASELAFARAVRLSQSDAATTEIVDYLNAAVRFNRFNDAAERALAQALVVRVGEELSDLTDVSTVTAEKQTTIRDLSSAAIRSAVRATELSPRNPLNWLSRGAVYRAFIPLGAGAGQAAIEAYQRAVDEDPLNPANETELAKTYIRLAELSDKDAGSNDSSVADAAARESANDLALAENALNAAVALKADYAPAHYQLAMVYERRGQLDEAVGKMESVKKYNPLDVGVAFQLGLLYLHRAKNGDLALAQAELERAVDLAPTFSNARWFLSSVYERQGDTARAIEQMKKVLEYNPENQEVKSRLAELQGGTASQSIPPVLGE